MENDSKQAVLIKIMLVRATTRNQLSKLILTLLFDPCHGCIMSPCTFWLLSKTIM